MKLTGNVRVRDGWGGRLILQVEESFVRYEFPSDGGTECTRWRDARVTDLASPFDVHLRGIDK